MKNGLEGGTSCLGGQAEPGWCGSGESACCLEGGLAAWTAETERSECAVGGRRRTRRWRPKLCCRLPPPPVAGAKGHPQSNEMLRAGDLGAEAEWRRQQPNHRTLGGRGHQVSSRPTHGWLLHPPGARLPATANTLSAWILKITVGQNMVNRQFAEVCLFMILRRAHGSLLAELRDRPKLDLWGSPGLHLTGLSLLSSSGNKLNNVFSFLSPSPPPSSFQQTT